MIDYGVSFGEVLRDLGKRARALRLVRGIRQEELAARAGLGIATVRRFERTGVTSIENVLRMATVLGAEGGFAKLFEAPRYTSIDEALSRPRRRQRASRSK